MTAVLGGSAWLPAPHGGRLAERLVPADRAEALAAQAARLPAVSLDGRALADLECLAVGAFSPLAGFLGEADHARVVEQGRLADGTVWTLPVVLPVPAEVLAFGPDRLALTDQAGTVLAVVDVQEVHDPDPATEAKLVFETDDPAHPGVAATLARRGPLVGGAVQVLRLPATPSELGPRLTPAQVRAEAMARGWRSMAGFQTRNPVHRAHEYLHKVALEHVDGLLLHPLVGETKDDDVPAALRWPVRALLDGYTAGRVLRGPGGHALRRPREAVSTPVCAEPTATLHRRPATTPASEAGTAPRPQEASNLRPASSASFDQVRACFLPPLRGHGDSSKGPTRRRLGPVGNGPCATC